MTERLPRTLTPRPLTERARQVFLEALAAGWSVTSAAERAGFGRQRFYELRDQDVAFAESWAEAFEHGTDLLEDELRRRALEGFDEETFDGEGTLVRRLRRISPPDLITALKARRPDVYRDNAKVELAGRVDVPQQPLEGQRGVPLSEIAKFLLEAGALDGLMSAEIRSALAASLEPANDAPLELGPGDVVTEDEGSS